MSCLCFVLCFFFFKQKTAYEMRISDWSSDVCSSDLAKTGLRRTGDRLGLAALFGFDAGESARGIDEGQHRQAELVGQLHQADRLAIAFGLGHPEIVDRTRVVSGKSGSVRVDLGGRRLLKKKKQP